MEIAAVVAEIVLFVALLFAYYHLCFHREIGMTGKVAEIVSLYVVTISAFLGHLKFIGWMVCVIIIGATKILTTKRHKSERKNIGHTV